MKKFLVIMAMLAATVAADAQQVRTFHWKDGGYWVKVDLDKKTFLADGCGVDPETIKNYKKSGNKESFGLESCFESGNGAFFYGNKSFKGIFGCPAKGTRLPGACGA